MLPLVLTAVLFAQTFDKPILDDLLTKGIAVPGGPKVLLPKPIAGNDPTPAERKKLEAWIKGEVNRQVFEKDDKARYYYKNRSIAGDQHHHIVSVAFIAYGKIDRIEKEKLLDELLGAKQGKGPKKPIELNDNDLKACKIVRVPKGKIEEKYGVIDTTLDDYVRITGVMRTQTWKGKRQITSTSILDDRFLNDETNPNRYRKITQVRGGGVPVEGPPKPYSGFGGYARVTELDEPAGALFVEMIFIYHEPKEWFNGKELLVPRLKIAIDDNITNFRRALRAKPKP